MKLSDLKLLFPRIRYSSHTPKAAPVPEGYYMSESPLKGCKPKMLEKTPPADEFSENIQKPVEELFEGVYRKNGSNKIVF